MLHRSAGHMAAETSIVCRHCGSYHLEIIIESEEGQLGYQCISCRRKMHYTIRAKETGAPEEGTGER